MKYLYSNKLHSNHIHSNHIDSNKFHLNHTYLIYSGTVLFGLFSRSIYLCTPRYFIGSRFVLTTVRCQIVVQYQSEITGYPNQFFPYINHSHDRFVVNFWGRQRVGRVIEVAYDRNSGHSYQCTSILSQSFPINSPLPSVYNYTNYRTFAIVFCFIPIYILSMVISSRYKSSEPFNFV